MSRPAASPGGQDTAAGRWTFGEDALDAVLPGGGLDVASVVELKPLSHGDWPATLAFAACLAVRRRQAGTIGAPERPILWCFAPGMAAEHGALSGPGLAELGLAPETLLIVEASRATGALWALEEGARSGALALAVGVLREAGLTPSRRLALAASAARTPVVLVTHPASAPAAAAALRLRLNRLPGAPHPFDPGAPGGARLGLTLERCRGGAPMAEGLSLELEWCDVAHRFRLVAGLVDRASAAPVPRQRARG